MFVLFVVWIVWWGIENGEDGFFLVVVYFEGFNFNYFWFGLYKEDVIGFIVVG